ncbi:winged helix DNA-binding domain-containing protein [Ornithinimicrobium faecis]|uniref:winged helix DNA-binding domain-containing protein n=1 Tax=Ornithinimicrobium faecis TaxID=2934158 RepID=UPI002117AB88|nr:winged helix DNA-binding domain-containing protein [Ornithinimicrobium sp. HY1745]
MRTVTWPEANARRLARQFAGAATPDAAVYTMLAAQAQVASAAELSIALRLREGTCVDVRAGLADQSLVRASGLRGTIHTVAAADLGLWTGTFATMPAGRMSAGPDLQPSPAEVDRLCAAIGDTTASAATPLTLEELHNGVVDRVGSWAGDLVMPAFQTMWPRWRLVQAEAARRGLLSFGPNRGRAVTYTAPPTTAPIEPRAAAEQLLLRYLSAYGPSTPAAYAKWHAAPIGWATRTFEALTGQGRVVEVDLEGTRAWVVHDDLDFAADPPTGIRLLPYFDALGIAAFPRERFFPGRAAVRALAGGQAGNYPIVLVDGEVAGVWHQRKAGRRVTITVEPLFRVTRRRQAELEEAVERIGHLQDLRPELVVGEVTTGAHA